MKSAGLLYKSLPILFLLMGGCSYINFDCNDQIQTARGYQPLNPISFGASSGSIESHKLFNESVLIAVSEVSKNAQVSYGPATIGYEGRSYRVVMDYIRYKTYSYKFDVTESKRTNKGKFIRDLKIDFKDSQGQSKSVIDISNTLDLKLVNSEELSNNATDANVAVPVYAGIGLRLVAGVTVTNGDVDLGSLASIGLAANAKKLSGSLHIQSFGISTTDVTLPLPNDISNSTIQTMMQTLATIKSKISDSKTKVTPQILGYENANGISEMRDAVYSIDPAIYYRTLSSNTEETSTRK